MNAGLLNVLHDAANPGGTGVVTDAIDVAFDRVIQKPVQQHGRIVADLDGLAHVALQIALLVHHFHGASAQHVAGAHHQRVTQRSRFFQGLGLGAGGGVGGLAQVERVQQFLKTLAVLGGVNHVRAGTDDGYAVGL